MRDSNRILCAITCGVILAAPAIVLAQDTAPARETPRPQDIDPAVNTSATPPAESEAPAKPAPSGAATGGQIEPRGEPTATPSNATPDGVPRNAKPSTASSTAPSTTAKPGAATSSDGKPKGRALDRLELDTTQITGNRELPKVLYIVPWKRADLGDLVGKPVNSLLDEVLTPVDRDVFKRENRYYRALAPAEGQPEGTNGATPAATAPGAASSTGSAAPPARDER